MLMIYDSPNYYVLEFLVQAGTTSLTSGGYEIINKKKQKEIFLNGVLAQQFRTHVKKFITNESYEDEVDEFLEKFDRLMTQPVLIH